MEFLRENIFKEINQERKRQNRKWGEQNHEPFAWLAILGEEVGEVNKAALETHFKYPGADTNYSEYRKELIQVAAVAVSMIECHDRKKLIGKKKTCTYSGCSNPYKNKPPCDLCYI